MTWLHELYGISEWKGARQTLIVLQGYGAVIVEIKKAPKIASGLDLLCRSGTHHLVGQVEATGLAALV